MKTMIIGLSVLMLGLGMAFAASHTDGRFLAHPGENDLRASDLMGATVFVTEAEVAATTVQDVPQDWESVATIEDFLLAQDGTIRGVLVDVGGFLGIGARQVMVSMAELNLVRQQDSDDLYVVFNSTREELEQAPEYQNDPMASDTTDEEMMDEETTNEEMMDEEMSDEEMTAQEESSADQAQADEARRLGVPEEAMEGFQLVDVGTLTVDELKSAAVYDRLNEPVSDISDVQLSSEGSEVVAVLIDVGGFLGLGARTVAVDIDQIEIQMDPERNDLRVYLDMTREELEALPEYME